MAEKTRKKARLGVFNIALMAILILYTVLLMALLIWGCMTSLKTRGDFYDNKLGLPSGSIATWGWDNYSFVLKNFAVEKIDSLGRKISINIWGQLINTLLYAVGGGLVTTACCCIVAYLTAKFPYFFSKIVYTVVLITMVIPIVGSTPSMLLFLRQTGLYDTWLGTFLMRFTFLGLYYLIFHGVFEGISKEYSEAATLDGANEYRIFFLIILPLVKTTFYTVFLIQFIGYWNDYNMALMYMPTHPTLAYGVYYMSVSNMNGLSGAPMRMVACVILALPLITVFVLFRNKIMGNVTMGGVKE